MPCCFSLYSARRTSRRIAPEAPASISTSIAAAPASAIMPSARAIATFVTPGFPFSSRSFAIASAGAAAGSKPASTSFVSSGFVSREILKVDAVTRVVGAYARASGTVKFFIKQSR